MTVYQYRKTYHCGHMDNETTCSMWPAFDGPNTNCHTIFKKNLHINCDYLSIVTTTCIFGPLDLTVYNTPTKTPV